MLQKRASGTDSEDKAQISSAAYHQQREEIDRGMEILAEVLRG